MWPIIEIGRKIKRGIMISVAEGINYPSDGGVEHWSLGGKKEFCLSSMTIIKLDFLVEGRK